MLNANLSIKSSLTPLIFPTRRPRYPRRPKFQPPRDRRNYNLRRNPRFQVFAEYGVGVSADDSSKMGEECSLVEISATRTLPAAVTYMEGVRRLRAAVEEVKANPPGFSSGVLRFQVAVPPSSKALNWLCCQHGSLVTLPQFCLIRNELHELPQNLDGMLGVSGIGSTIYFHGSLSTFKQYNAITRYPLQQGDMFARG